MPLYSHMFSVWFGSNPKYGAIKGGLLALWRILRCNPFLTEDMILCHNQEEMKIGIDDLATKNSTPIIGQISVVMGWIMNGIYKFLDGLFGIQNLGLCIIISVF